MIVGLNEINTDKLESLYTKHWGSPFIVVKNRTFDLRRAKGFIVLDGDQILGLVHYDVKDKAIEVVSLLSLQEGRGIGNQLMQAVEAEGRHLNCEKCWLITTNDNTHALKFYQKHGYEIVAIYLDAVAKARQLKPEIPMLGNDGIPIQHEIELMKSLKGLI